MTELQTYLLARFSRIRRSLDEVLSQLTDAMLDQAPSEGMRTVSGQLFEIVGKEVELLAYARAGGDAEWEEIEPFGAREATIEGWRGILHEVRTNTIAFIEQASDDQLNALVKFDPAWWEGLGLDAIPMHEVLRNIAAHEWYHTGQLVSYLQQWQGSPYDG